MLGTCFLHPRVKCVAKQQRGHYQYVSQYGFGTWWCVSTCFQYLSVTCPACALDEPHFFWSAIMPQCSSDSTVCSTLARPEIWRTMLQCVCRSESGVDTWHDMHGKPWALRHQDWWSMGFMTLFPKTFCMSLHNLYGSSPVSRTSARAASFW